MNEEKISRIFQKAVPVWLPGKKKGWNEFAGFYTQLHTAAPETITFRIAARSFYRMYLNGERIADGPARTAKGCCRVDELTIRFSGENHVAFDVLERMGEIDQLVTEMKDLYLPVLRIGHTF